jgi:hypothetical protein
VEHDRPVTLAMHKDCAPMTEKMKDAIKDENRASDTPYWFVDYIERNQNAIPGSTLTM